MKCLKCDAEYFKGEPHECDPQDVIDMLRGQYPAHDDQPDFLGASVFRVSVKDGYHPLMTILHRALHQAQDGNGHKRHANGLPFDQQPIMQITRRHGAGFALGQIEKKTDEAGGMIGRKEFVAAEQELLGAINYAAAAILWLHELQSE